MERVNWPVAVRRYREVTGKKQEALAREIGVNQGAVSKWEAGLVSPDKESQQKLLALFKADYPLLEKNLRETIEASDRYLVAINKDGEMVAVSAALEKLLNELNASGFSISHSPCGMWRITELVMKKDGDEPSS